MVTLLLLYSTETTNAAPHVRLKGGHFYFSREEAAGVNSPEAECPESGTGPSVTTQRWDTSRAPKEYSVMDWSAAGTASYSKSQTTALGLQFFWVTVHNPPKPVTPPGLRAAL